VSHGLSINKVWTALEFSLAVCGYQSREQVPKVILMLDFTAVNDSGRSTYCAGRRLAILAAAILLSTLAARADTISFSGSISQSTSDGTGPAVNNPDLNDIQDGDLFTVTLDFAGSINAPGTYPLAGFSLLFEDSSSPVAESSFDSVSVSVISDGSFYDFSMLACLTTGTDCLTGNSLSAFFQIPVAGLNAQNVAAQAAYGIAPLDLLEDDGVTDMQGSVSSYSYVPEPSALLPLCLMLAATVRKRSRMRNAR
jgi:hypothetical protein